MTTTKAATDRRQSLPRTAGTLSVILGASVVLYALMGAGCATVPAQPNASVDFPAGSLAVYYAGKNERNTNYSVPKTARFVYYSSSLNLPFYVDQDGFVYPANTHERYKDYRVPETARFVYYSASLNAPFYVDQDGFVYPANRHERYKDYRVPETARFVYYAAALSTLFYVD